MIATGVQVRDEKVQMYFDSMIARGQNLRPPMSRIGLLLKNSMLLNFVRGGRPTRWKKSRRALRGGGQTLRQTGDLANSISPQPTESQVIVGSNKIYAGVHDKGKRIHAKKKRFLTIPLEGALTPAGHLKGPARSFENTFFHRSDTGKLFLMQSLKNNEAVPLFLLVRSVKMPKRRFAMIQTEDWDDITDILESYIIGEN